MIDEEAFELISDERVRDGCLRGETVSRKKEGEEDGVSKRGGEIF